jgi:hypothetical protein
MEAQSWIICQVIIDLFIAGLLIWSIRLHFKDNFKSIDSEKLFAKSEKILSDMNELSQSLDKNLEEKRELSRKTLRQLDEGLRRAEDSFQQIQNLIREFGSKVNPQSENMNNTQKLRSSISRLLDKGLSKEEIAHHLGISIGEIELLSKLKPRSSNLVSTSEKNQVF